MSMVDSLIVLSDSDSRSGATPSQEVVEAVSNCKVNWMFMHVLNLRWNFCRAERTRAPQEKQ